MRSLFRPPLSERLQALVDAVPRVVTSQSVMMTAVSGQPVFVTTAAQAEAMYMTVRRMQPIAIGADTEYQFSHSVLFERRRKRWQDPRSIRPLLLSLSVLEERGGEHRIAQFVVDVRQPEVLEWLQMTLDLRDLLVLHHAQDDMLALKALGLSVHGPILDTYIAWNAINRGRYHRRYLNTVGHDATGEEAQELKLQRGGLVALAANKGIGHAFAARKSELQQSFLNHPCGAGFTEDQINYAACDATVAAQLYVPVMHDLVVHGLAHHVMNVEMPAAIQLANMVWRGLRQDPDLSDIALDQAKAELARTLAGLRVDHGIKSITSRAVLEFAERTGIRELFATSKTRSGYTTSSKHLTRIRRAHPAIARILHARNYEGIIRSTLLTGGFISPTDGRVHPELDLGAQETGRISCKDPALMALPKALRYVVVPEQGSALIEFDFKQEEVVIAAALAGDQRLLADLRGDIYRMFVDQVLPFPPGPVDQAEFDKRRNRAKTVVLSILYGRTVRGLAQELGVSLDEARAYRRALLDRYPRLATWLKELEYVGQARGWARSALGTRRLRGRAGPVNGWERRWFRNSVVQGTGADVIRLLLARLAPRLDGTGAQLILIVHDSALVEVPIGLVEHVKRIVEETMIAVFHEILPGAPIKVDVKDKHLGGWGPRKELGSGGNGR